MNKNKNILSSLLLVSSLTLTPFLSITVHASSQLTQNSLSNTVAKNLHRRGIDKEASKKIANNIFNIDEELFTLMLQNLEQSYPSLNKAEILNFLSTQALMKKSVNLNSYSYLVNMMHQIKNKIPNKDELNILNAVATRNSNIALQSLTLHQFV